MDTAMARQKSESRYPATSLGTEEESAEYWLKGYNHSVFKVMSRIDENVIDIKDDVAGIKEDVSGVKSDIAEVKSDIAALTKIVREGFASLGVNISNGDGRIARPVR